MSVAVAVAVSGCSANHGTDKPARDHTSSGTTKARPEPKSTSHAAEPASKPHTAAQFVARARQAMGAEKGWTFALSGSESAVMRGQAPSSATYAATVHRTTAPEALEQTGTITTGKGERKPEAVYVVGGTGYVKEGAGAWKKGPLTDTEIADDVEDPVAELAAFATYAKSAKVTGAGGGDVRLQVTASGWQLSAARSRPALKKAVREVEPTLAQLRKAGVRATDGQITLRSFSETWDLDAAHGYRITSHRYAFTFLVPFQGGDITVSQEVRAENRGVFTGSVTLPSGVG
ncbi:hypothetical protein [Streptomyces carpinensis]|uniref:Lipoprotein n=1 Tax=Streptomyces carpinensis TaxID=66369 RepID=A0ABV1W2X0_9ACTN|nr:hypothetical protein [Streptomyces carpinensis]